MLINNAGLDLSGPALLDTTLADARRIFDVNVFGALQMLQAAARAMRERRRRDRQRHLAHGADRPARLGGLRRVEGRAGEPDPRRRRRARRRRHPRELRRARPHRDADDRAPGSRSSPIRPRILRRVLADIPQQRLAPPEDVAAAICFLASDAAGSITGACLSVDGGYTAR